ncbi:hypothetical protein C0J52_06741 [Blattella germanica]|nr:hypothetical protein C0J52_06741 [Blattella germanica]
MCNKIVERESHQLGGEEPDEMMEVISPIITLVLLGLVLFLSFKICCMITEEETQAKPNNAITSAKTKEAESMVKLELSQNTQPPTVPTGGASAPVDIGYPISTMLVGDIPQGIQQNEHARIISVVPNSEPVYQGAVPKEWFSGSNSMYNQSNLGPVITTTTTPAHPQAAIFIPVIPPPPHVPQRSSMMSTSNYNYDYPKSNMKGLY